MDEANPSLLLSQALENTVDNHRSDWDTFFHERWDELGLNSNELSMRIRAVAEGYIGDVSELKTAKAFPLEDSAKLQNELPEAAHESVVIAEMQQAYCLLGDELAGMMATAEKRLLELLILARKFPRHVATARFLKRVARCFLFGFDVECIVMCRAAIDRTLQERVSDLDCQRMDRDARQQAGGRPKRYGMKARINAGIKVGKISPDVAEKAIAISKAGDDAVHNWPECHVNLIGAIGDTIEILVELGEK